MEKLITVRELFKETDRFIDRTVQVGGWVRNNRGSKAFGFLVINDGSFYNTLQVVYGESLSNFAEIGRLNVGSAVIVTGKLVATPNAKQPCTRIPLSCRRFIRSM